MFEKWEPIGSRSPHAAMSFMNFLMGGSFVLRGFLLHDTANWWFVGLGAINVALGWRSAVLHRRETLKERHQ